MRQQIFDEIKARTKETDLSVPTRRGDWWYYGRSFQGKQYGVQCRCPPVADPPDDWTPPQFDENTEIPGEQVLLDENVEAEGHDFFSLGAATVSIDGSTLAYSVDVKGDERYTLRFKDIRTGERYDDEIVGIGAGATWAADNHTVYYVTVDDAWRPDTVWRHRLGAGLRGAGVPRTRRAVLGRGRANAQQQVRHHRCGQCGHLGIALRRCDRPAGRVRHRLAASRERRVLRRPRRRRRAGSFPHPAQRRRRELHPRRGAGQRSHAMPHPHRTPRRRAAHSVDAFGGHLVVSYRKDALPRIQLWPIEEAGYGQAQDITFDSELMSVGGLSANPNWSAPKLRIGATSFVTPPVRIYDLDLGTGERTLLREQPVLGDYRPEDYVERRDWAVASDGARVPISIIHRAGLRYPAPMLLYGYGAYESCEDPRFSIARLSLLDRGMVFAIAHVRGGGELGRPWYEHGKMLEKRNTFTDFISVAAHLVGTDVTRPENLVAYGGSAGGSADGGGGQPGTRSVRRDPGLCALRRPAHHDPRPVAAADGHRVGRMGETRWRTPPKCTAT